MSGFAKARDWTPDEDARLRDLVGIRSKVTTIQKALSRSWEQVRDRMDALDLKQPAGMWDSHAGNPRQTITDADMRDRYGSLRYNR